MLMHRRLQGIRGALRLHALNNGFPALVIFSFEENRFSCSSYHQWPLNITDTDSNEDCQQFCAKKNKQNNKRRRSPFLFSHHGHSQLDEVFISVTLHKSQFCETSKHSPPPPINNGVTQKTPERSIMAISHGDRWL